MQGNPTLRSVMLRVQSLLKTVTRHPATLLIPVAGLLYLAGYQTLAGGVVTGSALLVLNAGIDRAMGRSGGDE